MTDALLPTPTVQDGANTAGPSQAARNTPPLNSVAVQLMPTPKASDGPHGGPGMRNGRGDADALPGIVHLLPTPAVNDMGAATHEAFGPYAAAVARWEHVLGRPAPAPAEPGRALNPAFVEFMMGLPAGWVTDTGIPRNAQLKALGNGIVPQQMALAIRLLLDDEAVAA